MKRLKFWLIKRLTTPELGELRRFHGLDYGLVSISSTYESWGGGLELRYAPMIYLEDQHLVQEDEKFHDGTG
jgi:hypothetical protein